MEAVQTQLDYPRGVTFEQVWALVKEVAESQKESQRETDRIIKENQRENARRQEELNRQMKERQAETDRQMKERQAETDRQMKERQAETDRQMKEYNKRFGDFTNRFGEIVEYMVAPNLREKFRELGYDFPKANPHSNVADYKNNIHLEIDVLLENGDKAMLVEIKTKLTTEHINEHIERLEKMRTYADLRGDKRSFLGAVAGVIMPSNVKEYALRQGLFAIEPSGETFNITSPNSSPKEW
ncbi:MAG: hypothetical protein FWD36_01500 [Treponema sp.]|nr:hypothetical protein [Treponema sp.]